MKTYITALVLVFALATVTSMISLTHIDSGSHTVGHQKLAFLY